MSKEALVTQSRSYMYRAMLFLSLAVMLAAFVWALMAYLNPNMALDLASFMQMCAAFLKP